MSENITKTTSWSLRIGGIMLGSAITWLSFKSYSISFSVKMFTTVFEKVGITIIALIPLAAWAIYTMVKTDNKSDITLAYIGTTAQRVGLLGTVIGIVAATIAIGDNLSTGAATAVTGALPAVGQALVSTAVGFVIAITCDFFRYIRIKEVSKEL